MTRSTWAAALLMGVLWCVLIYHAIRVGVRQRTMAALQATRDKSPRAGGIPRNIIEPRSRWTVTHDRAPIGVHFHVTHTRYQDVRPKFAVGAYIHKWPSWDVVLVVFGHAIRVQRYCERWATPT